MTVVFLPLLAVFCFFLIGCSNILGPLAKNRELAADGYGKLDIRFTGDEARTIFPLKDIFDYRFTFTLFDGDSIVKSVELEPGEDGLFTLENGDWKVGVEAFVGGVTGGVLVANGASERFNIGSGSAKIITITLEVIPGSSDNGAFIYNISLQNGIEVSEISLKNLITLSDVVLNPGTMSGGITQTLNLPEGYYLLTVQLKSGGYSSGINEVIHIYPKLATKYEKTFELKDLIATTVNISAMTGLVTPVVGQAQVSGAVINTAQFSGNVAWSPAHSSFQAETVYSANITLAAKPGYTLNGVTLNFFTVELATSVANPANSGVVTAVFNPITVNFNSMGGGQVTPAYTFRGQRINKPADPPQPVIPPAGKTGWTFAGWFYDSQCTNPVSFRRDTFTQNCTLYARWLPGEDWIPINEEDNLADLFPIIGEDENGDPIQDGLDGEYYLEDDISLEDFNSGGGWVPLGSSEANPFTGIFDGNGRKVTFLFIDREDSMYVGLFGAIKNAEVRNLGVEISGSGIVGNNDVGGITGNAKSSLIENCYVKGNITANGSVGGIAAHIGSNTIIRNCYTEGSVTALFAGEAGGIVGNMKDGGRIENCYSTMAVISDRVAGGIVGLIQDRNPPDQHSPDADVPKDVPKGPPAGMFVTNCVAMNSAITSSASESFGRIVGIIEAGLQGDRFDPPIPDTAYHPWIIGGPTTQNGYTLLQTISLVNNHALSSLPQASLGINLTQRNGTNATSGNLATEGYYIYTMNWVFHPVTGPWKWDAIKNRPILFWED